MRNCPVCLSKGCPVCKQRKKYVIPESLIVIIQNINQNYTKEQRDKALIDLTNQFQYLIKKNTTCFYKLYDLKKKDYEYNDLYQDVLLQFYDLVINDFKIKQEGDNNLAVFGNYIKNKLYHRVQYGIQEKLKKFGWKNEIETGFDITENKDTFRREIYEATLAQITECEEKDLENIRHERCIQISFNEKICAKIDGEIWRLHWFSGKSVEQIDEYLIMEMQYGCKVGESRIRQIVKKTNQKIIAEFGRLSALGGVDV
jgi:hypothetical protein